MSRYLSNIYRTCSICSILNIVIEIFNNKSARAFIELIRFLIVIDITAVLAEIYLSAIVFCIVNCMCREIYICPYMGKWRQNGSEIANFIQQSPKVSFLLNGLFLKQ